MLTLRAFRIKPDVKLTEAALAVLRQAYGDDAMTDSAIQEYVAEMTRHALKSVQVIPADQRQNFTRQLSTIICYAFDEQNRKVPLVIMSQLVHAPLKGFLSRTIYFMTIDEARKKDEAGQLYVEVIAKFTADALALRPVAPTPTPTPTLILVK